MGEWRYKVEFDLNEKHRIINVIMSATKCTMDDVRRSMLKDYKDAKNMKIQELELIDAEGNVWTIKQ